MISNEDKTHPHASGIVVYCAHDNIVPIGELHENPNNPNKHPDSQIELLSKIIKTQGWRNPIVVSKLSNCITKGHARLASAKILNLNTVPVDYQTYETKEAEMADMLADNRIAELSDLAIPEVKNLIAELERAGADLDLTGYDELARQTLALAFDKVSDSEESGQNQFQDFKHRCPKCGFEWTRDNNDAN